MDFGEQIKSIRQISGITQEQMAQKLNVTRQAVSNWENNRNLPDIEMLITIASTFSLTLDTLILGDDSINNMTEKLINDTSESRRAKLNLVGIITGAVLLIIGAGLIVIKGLSVEYIDENDFLHENFFLLPIGFAFIFGGLVSFIVTGVRGVIHRFSAAIKKKRDK